MAYYIYRRVSVDHPLAPINGCMLSKDGRTVSVGQHRLVLFEKIGPGQHPCHWCGASLEWRKGVRAGVITADHLNGDKMDNRPENLAPACNGCNSIRARTKFRPPIAADEITVMRTAGRTRAVERKCQECGARFIAVMSLVSHGGGRYCSMHCVGLMSSRRRWG